MLGVDNHRRIRRIVSSGCVAITVGGVVRRG